MYPILLFSIVALAIAIERIFYYRRTMQRNKNMVAEISVLVKSGDIAGAIDKASLDQSTVGKVIAAYIKNCKEPQGVLEDAIHSASSREVRSLEKHLPVLSAIAALAPLLGLLGTVLGMIITFQEISRLGGEADMAALSGGIWQALLTTAFGLIVAIPVAAFHHYFQNLVDVRISQIETKVSDLNILFKPGTSFCIEAESDNSKGNAGV
ncbi:MAG: MotA/TolQ/ExbB proton channel family protein [Spirochaetota bacterium]